METFKLKAIILNLLHLYRTRFLGHTFALRGMA